jgi:hypothetical protein
MIKRIFDIIKTYSGYFFAVAAIVSFIFTLGVKSERKSSSNLVVIDSIASFSKEIRAVRVDVNKVMVDQVAAKDASIEAKNAYNSLRVIVLDLVKKQPGMTFDQFQQYIEGSPELKKKNFTNQIPYKNENLILTLK